MATIKTSLMIHDGMTDVIQKMYRAVNILLDSFEEVQRTSGKAVDTSNLREARQLAAESAAAWDQMADHIREADQAQQGFNSGLRAASPAADALNGKLKAVLATVMSIAGVKSALNWGKENLGFSDTQRNAERQLATVLMNVGATEEAFDSLKKTASDIQKRGIYGDEIMLGGAAEFATYMSDPKAIESMMGTLANYAMGMSGGEEIGYNQMVDYATQLGKALNGTFGGLAIKGFKLSDAQKEIIENGTDMEKALVLDDVIGESWDHLYEKMSNTPRGKVFMLKHDIEDVREKLGDRLYTAVEKVVDYFRANFDKIKNVLNGVNNAVGVLIIILGAVATAALTAGNFISENWGVIGPIILGVAGAYIILHGAILAYNAVKAISAGLEAVHAARIAMTTVAEGAQTTATFGATAAQYGLNAALLACPLVWIIGVIIAVIAAIYAVTHAINKWKGTTVSATGIIAGAFSVLLAHIANTFVVPLWNYLASVANFFGNVFRDPVAAVKVLFYDMCLTVLGYISNLAHAIEDLINKIPGVQVSITAGLDGLYNRLESAQKKVKDESGWVEYVKKMNFINYSDAAKAGYNFGKGVADKVSSVFKLSDYTSDMEWTNNANNLGNQLDSITNNTNGIADNTAATAQALGLSNEDLKLLREIAERQAINQFTTAEIKVEMNNNNTIASDVDLDGITDKLADKLQETMETTAEGVHT